MMIGPIRPIRRIRTQETDRPPRLGENRRRHRHGGGGWRTAPMIQPPLGVFTVAFLELLPAAAGAGVVAAHLVIGAVSASGHL